jgi:hypothetical protein
MTTNSLQTTVHAARRMAQRNVSLADAALVIRYGTVEYRTGVEFYFLAQRNIPPGSERPMERLVGTTVVVRDGRVETVYKNRNALFNIKRKPKHRRAAVPGATNSRALAPFSIEEGSI